jgi:hypothetical protein
MNSIAVYTIDIAILLSKSTVFSLGTKLSATDMIKTVRGQPASLGHFRVSSYGRSSKDVDAVQISDDLGPRI